MTFEQLKLVLKIQNVWRAVIHPIIPPIKLSDHSIRTYGLYRYFGGKEDLPTIMHDLEEVLTGDIPSPSKKHMQGLDYFESMRPPFESKEEKKLCKMCDKLCLLLQIRPYVNFSSDILSIYQEELDLSMEIARELGKTKDVKKLLKEISY